MRKMMAKFFPHLPHQDVPTAKVWLPIILAILEEIRTVWDGSKDWDKIMLWVAM